MKTIDSFNILKKYCEKEDYKGWDPYDGLNSKVFNATPLKNNWFCRLLMIQLFKRNPFNLRYLFGIDKDYNAKGIGLFVQGYVNLCKIDKDKYISKLKYVADLLVELQSTGYHGACWGYNFPWQRRKDFLFPSYTPTVVATNFCATALFEAYEITKDERYLNIALTSADFVLKDLHRSKVEGGEMFSYSPLPGHDTVFNASLLGSRILSYCYKYTKKEEYKDAARSSVAACCHYQQEDGSWAYGIKETDSWIDSFHTGYNLDGLIAYEELCDDKSFHENIIKGFEYYVKNFFLENGEPKYYNKQQYPIDIHCPGQLFVTLSRLHKFKEYETLAEKVLQWTENNMQDKKGYFYYQLKKGISSKIPYMRWSNAFMFCALTYFLIEKSK
ncbi:delta-aminolevulinic acid dehydratase [Segatella bryantii]|uniref:delta-aminolevulinic acid dehydratase n=1 Tax=Segatella bryantii TaxID=77095 RepID=UPI00241E6C53|nr:delta-aminolevulinic acid dehydratase [Segatella bryantii]